LKDITSLKKKSERKLIDVAMFINKFGKLYLAHHLFSHIKINNQKNHHVIIT